MAKRNTPDLVYSIGKPYGHNAAIVDAYGHVVREGDEVFLLYSSIRKSWYIIDEINSHIAYLRPFADSRVQPFPVLSGQIMKVKRRQPQV
jgi:hypothetical protein